MYAIVKAIDGEEFDRVTSYGFITEEGTDEEMEWLEDNAPEGDYRVVSYPREIENLGVYYIGGSGSNQFARTVSGAKDLV